MPAPGPTRRRSRHRCPPGRLWVESLSDRTAPSATGLVLSTNEDVSGSGAPGLDAWSRGEALRLGNPNLTLGTGTTSGTFSSLANIEALGDGAVDIDGVHYVGRQVTVGGAGGAITLLPGDLLFTTAADETLTGRTTVTASKDDVLGFRPDVPGDYRSGTFFVVLDNLKTVHGGGDTRDFALVEVDTVVGDASLTAGSFLFARDGGSEDNDVRLLVPTSAGQGRTAGSVAVLVEGDDLNFGAKITGLELVTTPTTVGGVSLPAGTLLLAIGSDGAVVGTNALSVRKTDVTALQVTRTTLAGGTAAATAFTLFRGADVGLDASPEALDAVALLSTTAPVAVPDSYVALEDTPLKVAAPGVLANDTDSEGDPLTVTLRTAPTRGTATLSADGSFTYVPADNFYGTETFTYTVRDGNGGSAVGTVTINVTPVNDAPSFTLAGNPAAVSEDAGPQTVSGFATNINTGVSPGPGGGTAPPQTVTFVVIGDTNPNLFAAGPAIAPDGTLTYTPAPNASGTATITVVARDDGGTANGGQDTSAPQTFVITVRPVNDLPAFDPVADRTVSEDPGPLAVLLTGISAGAGESQGLQVTAVSSNPALVPNPTVSYTSPASTGTLKYQPAANGSGSAVITVTVRDAGLDGQFGTADDGMVSRQFTVMVTPVNDPPTANPDAYSALAGLAVPAASGVLANDTDPEGDALTAVLVAGPDNGTLLLNPDGSFTYTPNPLYVGPDSFTYQARDPSGAPSMVAAVSISVALGDQPPIATDDAATVGEDSALAGPSVLANDADPNGSPLTARLVSGPTRGRLALRPDGTFTYVPAANYAGPDTFTYEAFDGQFASAPATVRLTVSPVNDLPVAGPDAASTPEDAAVTVPVLANDTDPEADPLTVVTVAPPANGTVSTDGTTVTYTPAPNFNGTDSFGYTVSDGNGGTAVAIVTVTVTAVDDPPTLGPIADRTILEDAGPQIVPLTGVSAGPGETQSVTVTATSSDPALIPNPVVTYTSPGAVGTLTFTPAANANGTATVAVTVSDGATTVTHTFTVTVRPVNDAPAAAPDLYVTDQNRELVVPAPGVLGNDSDVDGDPLTVTLVSGPVHGTLVLNADGSFTYTPDPGFRGTDRFNYRVTDPMGASSTTTVTIRVVPPSGRPVAQDDSYTLTEDGSLSVPAPGVLANDTPPGFLPLTARVATGPLYGTVAFNPDGSFTYIPNVNFTGTDWFTYRAVDINGAASSPARVTLTVTPAVDPPAGVADRFVTTQDLTLTVAAPGVLANDTDPDGDHLTAVLVTGPANGTLIFNPDGSFTYTPTAGFSGDDSFTYTVTDGQFNSNPIPVRIAVRSIVPPPVSEPVPPAEPAPHGPPVVPPPGGSGTAPVPESGGGGTPPSSGGSVLIGEPVLPVPPVIASSPPAFGRSGLSAYLVSAPAAASFPRAEVPAPGVVVPSLPPTPSVPILPPPVRVDGRPLPPNVPPVPDVLDVPAVPTVPQLQPDNPVFGGLDDLAKDVGQGKKVQVVTGTVVGTGVVATAGYVLLSPRLAYWLLSALLARRTVWKPFDPVEVLYAWERDRAAGGEDDDSLKDMLDSGPGQPGK